MLLKVVELKSMFAFLWNYSDLQRNFFLADRENLLKFEAEGQEFSKVFRSLEQFILTVKVQNNFWYLNRMLFSLLIAGFSDLLTIRIQTGKKYCDLEASRKS